MKWQTNGRCVFLLFTGLSCIVEVTIASFAADQSKSNEQLGPGGCPYGTYGTCSTYGCCRTHPTCDPKTGTALAFDNKTPRLCYCKPGYENMYNTCVPCAEGKFSLGEPATIKTTGRVACQGCLHDKALSDPSDKTQDSCACPADTYVFAPAWSSRTYCEPCMGKYMGLNCATYCVGYTGKVGNRCETCGEHMSNQYDYSGEQSGFCTCTGNWILSNGVCVRNGCEAGYFGKPCTICGPGTYSNGFHPCYGSDINTYTEYLASGITSTYPCPPGTFTGRAQHGVISCQPPVGQIINSQLEISYCPAGTYGFLVRNNYGPGQEWSGIKVCVPCPKGYVSDVVGALSCSPCAINKYADVPGMLQCIDCNPSMITMKTASPGEDSCMCNNERLYKSDAPEPTCISCPPNTATLRIGAVTNNECECPGATNICAAGEDNDRDTCTNSTGAGTLGYKWGCKKCDLGFYAESAGHGKCEACPPGMTTRYVGSRYFTDCVCADAYSIEFNPPEEANKDFLDLLHRKKPWSANIFSHYDGQGTVPDQSGNGRDVLVRARNGGTSAPSPSVAQVSTIGFAGDARYGVTSLRGSEDAMLTWPAFPIAYDSTRKMSTDFSVCWATRYSEVSGNRKAVLGCENIECEFGHSKDNGIGSILVNTQLNVITDAPLQDASLEQSDPYRWVVQCYTMPHRSSNTQTVLLDQEEIETPPCTTLQVGNLCINGGDITLAVNVHDASAASGFEIHSVYVWDKFLTTDELKIVTAALRKEVGGVQDTKKGNVIPMIPVLTETTLFANEIMVPHLYARRLVAVLRPHSFTLPAMFCSFQFPPRDTAMKLPRIYQPDACPIYPTQRKCGGWKTLDTLPETKRTPFGPAYSSTGWTNGGIPDSTRQYYVLEDDTTSHHKGIYVVSSSRIWYDNYDRIYPQMNAFTETDSILFFGMCWSWEKPYKFLCPSYFLNNPIFNLDIIFDIESTSYWNQVYLTKFRSQIEYAFVGARNRIPVGDFLELTSAHTYKLTAYRVNTRRNPYADNNGYAANVAPTEYQIYGRSNDGSYELIIVSTLFDQLVEVEHHVYPNEGKRYLSYLLVLNGIEYTARTHYDWKLSGGMGNGQSTFSSWNLWGSTCMPGTYSANQDNSGECLPCRQGTYNPNRGQTECRECPSGMSTAKTGSHTIGACLVDERPNTCAPGQFSLQDRKGLGIDVIMNGQLKESHSTTLHYLDNGDLSVSISIGYGRMDPLEKNPAYHRNYEVVSNGALDIKVLVQGSDSGRGCYWGNEAGFRRYFPNVDLRPGELTKLSTGAPANSLPYGHEDCRIGQTSWFADSIGGAAPGGNPAIWNTQYGDIFGPPAGRICLDTARPGSKHEGTVWDPTTYGEGGGNVIIQYTIGGCRPCPPGSISVLQLGIRTCKKCLPGSFSAYEGSIACKLCPAGSLSNVYGATSCVPCSLGTSLSQSVCTEDCKNDNFFSFLDLKSTGSSFPPMKKCDLSYGFKNMKWLLQKKRPIGVTIFTQYTPKIGLGHLATFRDPRGFPYAVSVDGEDNANITTTLAEEGRSTKDVMSLHAPSDTKLQWPEKLPPTFTICWANRYVGTAENAGEGLLKGLHSPSSFGHYKTFGGFFYNGVHSPGMVDSEDQREWLVACFSRQEAGGAYYVIEQNNFTHYEDEPQFTQNNNETLSVNYVGVSNDFEFHSFYAWDSVLDATEMKIVTKSIRMELGSIEPIDTRLFCKGNAPGTFFPVHASSSSCTTCLERNKHIYPNLTCDLCEYSKFSNETGLAECFACAGGMGMLQLGSVSEGNCSCFSSATYRVDNRGPCLPCAKGSVKNEVDGRPNVMLPIIHDSYLQTADSWRVSPRCAPFLVDGLVLHYPMKENKFVNVAKHVTLDDRQSVRYVAVKPGRIGSWYMNTFASGATKEAVSVSGDLGIEDLYTLSFWLNVEESDASPDTSVNELKLMEIDNIHLLFSSTDKTKRKFFISAAGNAWFSSYKFDPDIRWRHITLAANHRTCSFTLYVDGEIPEHFQSDSGACPMSQELNVITLFNKMKIDELRLYNRILVEDEVDVLCDRALRGLMFHAPFDSDLLDHSGNGAHSNQQVVDTTSFPFTNSFVGTGALYNIGTSNLSYYNLPPVPVSQNGVSFSFFVYHDQSDSIFMSFWTNQEHTQGISVKIQNTLSLEDKEMMLIFHAITPDTQDVVHTFQLQGKNGKHVVISIDQNYSPVQEMISNVWIDGNKMTSQKIDSTRYLFSRVYIDMFSADTPTEGDNMWGSVDDLRVYGRSLVKDDVETLYAKKNTMGGCFDTIACANITSSNTEEDTDDCYARVIDTKVEYANEVAFYNQEVNPVTTNTFLMYCSQKTRLTFNLYRRFPPGGERPFPFRLRVDGGDWRGDIDANPLQLQYLAARNVWTNDGLDTSREGHTAYLYTDNSSLVAETYVVHEFLYQGDLDLSSDSDLKKQTSYNIKFPENTFVEILVVAGGGAGGRAERDFACGGSGGGGEVQEFAGTLQGQGVLQVGRGGVVGRDNGKGEEGLGFDSSFQFGSSRRRSEGGSSGGALLATTVEEEFPTPLKSGYGGGAGAYSAACITVNVTQRQKLGFVHSAGPAMIGSVPTCGGGAGATGPGTVTQGGPGEKNELYIASTNSYTETTVGAGAAAINGDCSKQHLTSPGGGSRENTVAQYEGQTSPQNDGSGWPDTGGGGIGGCTHPELGQISPASGAHGFVVIAWSLQYPQDSILVTSDELGGRTADASLFFTNKLVYKGVQMWIMRVYRKATGYNMVTKGVVPARVLVVAGGGGGGGTEITACGGGGSGGQVREGVADLNGTYVVRVGTGGKRGNDLAAGIAPASGFDGEDSFIAALDGTILLLTSEETGNLTEAHSLGGGGGGSGTSNMKNTGCMGGDGSSGDGTSERGGDGIRNDLLTHIFQIRHNGSFFSDTTLGAGGSATFPDCSQEFIASYGGGSRQYRTQIDGLDAWDNGQGWKNTGGGGVGSCTDPVKLKLSGGDGAAGFATVIWESRHGADAISFYREYVGNIAPVSVTYQGHSYFAVLLAHEGRSNGVQFQMTTTVAPVNALVFLMSGGGGGGTTGENNCGSGGDGGKLIAGMAVINGYHKITVGDGGRNGSAFFQLNDAVTPGGDGETGEETSINIFSMGLLSLYLYNDTQPLHEQFAVDHSFSTPWSDAVVFGGRGGRISRYYTGDVLSGSMNDTLDQIEQLNVLKQSGKGPYAGGMAASLIVCDDFFTRSSPGNKAANAEGSVSTKNRAVCGGGGGVGTEGFPQTEPYNVNVRNALRFMKFGRVVSGGGISVASTDEDPTVDSVCPQPTDQASTNTSGGGGDGAFSFYNKVGTGNICTSPAKNGNHGIILMRYKYNLVSDATFDTEEGSHLVELGADPQSGLVSHIQVNDGADTCNFFTDSKYTDVICTQCPEGHERVIDSDGTTSCKTCRPGMFFSYHHKECRYCAAGSFSTGVNADSKTECTFCSPGTYQELINSTSCEKCAPGTFVAFYGSTEPCEGCPFEEMITESNENTCKCPPGSETVQATQFENPSCLRCSYEEYLNAVTGKCTLCTMNSRGTYPASEVCQCTTGYLNKTLYDSHIPVEGVPMIYHRLHIDPVFVRDVDDTCRPCPSFGCLPDQYLKGTLNCGECPEKSSSVEGSLNLQDCACFEGYGGVAACDACPKGTYKDSVGMSVCTVCNTTWDYLHEYERLTTATTASTSDSECVCNIGFYRANSSRCIACAEGFYKNDPGDHECVQCPSGTNTFGVVPAVLSSCLCHRGSERDLGVFGSEYCRSCSNSSYNILPGQACLSCPDKSFSGESKGMSCRCESPGYMYDGITTRAVTLHPKAAYNLNRHSCRICELDTFYNSSLGSCENCPATTGTQSRGSVDISFCVCKPGTKRVSPAGDVPVCESCADTNFMQSEYSLTTACTQCDTWSDSADFGFKRCICKNGAGEDLSKQTPAQASCDVCPETKFGNGRGVCKNCNLPSTTQHPDRTSCHCAAGWAYVQYSPFVSGSSFCNPCEINYFKPDAGFSPCQRCAEGSVATLGSSVCTICPVGTYALPQQGTCEPCTAGTYNDKIGQTECSSCHANGQWSVAGSSFCGNCTATTTGLIDRCVCDVDYVHEANVINVPCNQSQMNCTENSSDDCVPCGQKASCNSCSAVYSSRNFSFAVSTHGEIDQTHCSPCKLGSFLNVSASSRNSTVCESCVVDGVLECKPGYKLPSCNIPRDQDTELQECVQCTVEQNTDICFGFRIASLDCVEENAICVECNMGLIPDGFGGCHSAGRRADSFAYNDDKGRVYSLLGSIIWDVPFHVLQKFSYGRKNMCAMEQYTNNFYLVQDNLRAFVPGDLQTNENKLIDIDCNNNHICASYTNRMYKEETYDIDVPMTWPTVIDCLGENERFLPWKSSNLVSGDEHACTILHNFTENGDNDVYCFGDTAFGASRPQPIGGWNTYGINAKKLFATGRTTCVIEESEVPSEVGALYCWGFTPRFFEGTNEFLPTTSTPVKVELSENALARDVILIEVTTFTTSEEEIIYEKGIVVCALLHDYTLQCKGKQVHFLVLTPWRLAPYYSTFPSLLVKGEQDGEVCIEYNYYDIICWDVRSRPAAFQIMPDAVPRLERASLLQVLEPTLFYTNKGCQGLNEGTMLLASAFMYETSTTDKCKFNVPYCDFTTDRQKNFVQPAPDTTIAYPLEQEWHYLLSVSIPQIPDMDNMHTSELLLLATFDKSIWYHRYMHDDAGNIDYSSNPYLTFQTNGDVLLSSDTVSLRVDLDYTKLSKSYILVSVSSLQKEEYVDISVVVGDRGIVYSNYPVTSGVTFREYGHEQTTVLPDIQISNPHLVWVALQTGSERERWSGKTDFPWMHHDDSGTFINEGLCDMTKQIEGLYTNAIYMRIPVLENEFTGRIVHVGTCEEGHYDSTDPFNLHMDNFFNDTQVCRPCPASSTKPMAHLSSCIPESFTSWAKRDVGSIFRTMYSHRGFDGSIRMSVPDFDSDTSNRYRDVVYVAPCETQRIIDSFSLDTSGNPLCSDCLSLACRPWETSRAAYVDGKFVPCHTAVTFVGEVECMDIACDVSTGSKVCVSLPYPSCAGWTSPSLSCGDEEPNYIIVDSISSTFDAEGGEFVHTVHQNILPMESLVESGGTTTTSTQHARVMSQLQPDLLAGETLYDIVSLGQSLDLDSWRRSINPMFTMGTFWMEETMAIDICIGLLCITFEDDKTTVTIPDKLASSSALSKRKILSQIGKVGEKFLVNPTVVDFSNIDSTYSALYYGTDLTVRIMTHNLDTFALSTTIDSQNVSMTIQGIDFPLGISYDELNEHMIPEGPESYLPFVLVAMRRPTDSQNMYEKKFLGPSHFFRTIPAPTTDAPNNKTLDSMNYIQPCFDKFVRCAQIKTRLIFNENGEYEDENTAANRTSDLINTRRRLLQEVEASSGITPFVLSTDNSSKRFIQLTDVNFTFQSNTLNDAETEDLGDFRFSTRIRISDDVLEKLDGMIISNTLATSHNDADGEGFDMRIELFSSYHIRIHICGTTHVTARLLQGEWHEFSIVLKTRSKLYILHNGQPILTKTFRTYEGLQCSMNNARFTVGKSAHAHSAVGIDLQYILLNTDIRVTGTSQFADAIFTTNVSSLPTTEANFAAPTWTDEVQEISVGIMNTIIKSSYLNSETTLYPVLTANDTDMLTFVRVYMYDLITEERTNDNARGIVESINREFIKLRIPPISSMSNQLIFTQSIVPFLQLEYRTLPPTICKSEMYTKQCRYDGLTLKAHEITFDNHAIKLYDDPGNEISNFDTSSHFAIKYDDLVNLITYTDFDMRRTVWCQMNHCAMDFFVRTGPDMNSMTADINIAIHASPIKNVKLYIVVSKGIGVLQESLDGEPRDGLPGRYVDEHRTSMYLRIRTTAVPNSAVPLELSLELPFSPGFQHVRLVWIAQNSIIQVWIDGDLYKSQTYRKRPQFQAKYNAITIKSTVLSFGDSVREISGMHFVSNSQEVCTCLSSCPYNSYGPLCEPCPNNTITLFENSTERADCVCASTFYREVEDDPDSCVATAPKDIFTYNVSENLMKGFCTQSFPGQCDRTDTEIDGCSCADDCFEAVRPALLCCRNKCSLCPETNPRPGFGYCDCGWDPIGLKSYNRALTSGELCTGYMCAPGEYLTMGYCEPCPVNTYQDVSTMAVDTGCKPCRACANGFFNEGCGPVHEGTCVACNQCEETGFMKLQECSTTEDAICSDTVTCGMIRDELDCADGYYHANCDTSIQQAGWCELCPIQSPTDCGDGFFLNFQCLNANISFTPNECLPCNRARCTDLDMFPAPGDCGDRNNPLSFLEETIECSMLCTPRGPDEFTERPCQFEISRRR